MYIIFVLDTSCVTGLLAGGISSGIQVRSIYIYIYI